MWLFAAALSACAPRAAPPAPPAPVERVLLTLDPADLTYDEAARIARHTPGSAVQAAAYDVYEIDLSSLEQVLNGRPTAPVTVWVELGPAQVSSYTPEDPNLPTPQGGFQITTRAATVVGAGP